MGDLAGARQWFMRAMRLDDREASARNYLQAVCEPKLIQKASGQLPMEFFYDTGQAKDKKVSKP